MKINRILFAVALAFVVVNAQDEIDSDDFPPVCASSCIRSNGGDADNEAIELAVRCGFAIPSSSSSAMGGSTFTGSASMTSSSSMSTMTSSSASTAQSTTSTASSATPTSGGSANAASHLGVSAAAASLLLIPVLAIL
ncbi:hypothetical protein PHBOTO_005510 [Pseudozyma hubeiensis]|nr:hypothetical protein PHBOTO_005510 [Pseudozyma hubeiensis]